MRHIRPLLASALALGLALAGCSKKAPDSLLSYVPADSPYVFAVIDPVPQAYVDNAAQKFGAISGLYEQMIDDGLASLAKKDNKELADRVGVAILEELKGHISLAGVESLGFTPRAQLAVYGIGLVPVFRVELKDPAAFQAFVSRVEKRVGETLPGGKVGDQSYWRLGTADGKLAGLMAISGNQLVLSAMPKDASEPLLRQLLGLDLPARSIADSGTLVSLNKEFGFTANGSGYLDTVRLAQALIDEKTGIEKEYLKALGEEEKPVSAECRADFLAIAGNVPRLVAGYTRLDMNRMEANFVIQLKPELAKSMSALTAPVPGLGQDSDALFDFGMSLNVTKVADFVGAQARAVAAAPYKCAELAELNKAFADMQTQLGNPMMFAVAPVFSGFHVALTKLELPEGAMPVVAGKLALASDNPQSLIAMAQNFMPGLKALKLEAGAAPVALPAELSQPGMPPAHVALGDKALGVSVGAGEELGLAEFLKAPPADPTPILSFGYTGKFFEAIADTGMKAVAAAPEAERAQMERSFTVMREVYGKALKHTGVNVLLTDRGVEMRQTLEMN